MDAAELAREREARAGSTSPVVVLAYDNDERKDVRRRSRDVSDIERIFLWQGNARILVAIVKYVEDKRNVAHDTAAVGVPVILSSRTTSATTRRSCPRSTPSSSASRSG